ncbi:MAG: hypothetical protein AABX59_01135 [Nanoarchaeota archaeon]
MITEDELKGARVKSVHQIARRTSKFTRVSIRGYITLEDTLDKGGKLEDYKHLPIGYRLPAYLYDNYFCKGISATKLAFNINSVTGTAYNSEKIYSMNRDFAIPLRKKEPSENKHWLTHEETLNTRLDFDALESLARTKGNNGIGDYILDQCIGLNNTQIAEKMNREFKLGVKERLKPSDIEHVISKAFGRRV